MLRLYESAEIVDYYKYRPAYPNELGERIMTYCTAETPRKDDDKFDLMLDVGCGSGQACNLLQGHFKKIIGIDISEEQIKQAKKQNKFDNITYQIGAAEKLPAADGSVDLITAGIAAHWFNLPEFFKEVERVLKPTGCIALFGYNVTRIWATSQKNEDLTLETGKLLNMMCGDAVAKNEAERISSMENH